jgi:hypothetical protein
MFWKKPVPSSAVERKPPKWHMDVHMDDVGQENSRMPEMMPSSF